MNTGPPDTRASRALIAPTAAMPPIVAWAGGPEEAAEGDDAAQLARARAFAEPLLCGRALDTDENALQHADAVAAILLGIGAPPGLRAAAYLVYAGEFLADAEALVGKAFGASSASLVVATRKLMQLERAARDARLAQEQRGQQTERVHKMLLAFSRDLRVVLLRLASRLQTLRFFAATRTPCPPVVANESLQVFAPLANRLGLWQIKWELEDLSFRFLEPAQYRAVARLLDEKRLERERGIEAIRRQLADDLATHGLLVEVQGRPKHLYSIWKKMRGKALDFSRILDVRAVRVIVSEVADCYAVLGRVHELYRAVAGEFDDYIARPKSNGYQSLHTVVLDPTDRSLEVQIRTRKMHEHAEHGVAAHWAYKEARVKRHGEASAIGGFDARLTEARKSVLRQLLAWERDFAAQEAQGAHVEHAVFDERIYVFTPQAGLIELPAGATPVDFAYTVHTDLGHRCRGARVDGIMVPLNTPLQSGQTVDVATVKEGGPSLDWLNPELGYLRSARSKAKVRAWYNALAQRATIARGREAVEKVLQRQGRTAIKLDDLATQLGFRNAEALFEVTGKDEFSLHNIENLLRPPPASSGGDQVIGWRRATPGAETPKRGVLVVGVESLMTSLARCCRPAPPDAIGGYVTRGKGVAVHRSSCGSFRQMALRTPARVIEVEWGSRHGDTAPLYPVEVLIEAVDRQGLTRDISEIFAKERMNVTGVAVLPNHASGSGAVAMIYSVEVADASRLMHVLGLVDRVGGVRAVRRK